MGYSKPIETEHAIYVVSFEVHRSPDFSVLKKYHPDALILEGTSFPSAIKDWGKTQFAQKEYNDFFLHNPIVYVDPFITPEEMLRLNLFRLASFPTMTAAGMATVIGVLQKKAGKKSRRSFLAAAGLLGASALINPAFLASPLGNQGELGSIRHFLGKSYSIVSKPFFETLVEGRNAIIAEKMEAVVAPLFNARLGRKPLFVIQIGSGHHGIMDQLVSPSLRQKTILRLRSGIKKRLRTNLLDSVEIYRWNPSTKKVELESHSAPISAKVAYRPSLFSRPPLVVSTKFKAKKDPVLSRRELLFSRSRKRHT